MSPSLASLVSTLVFLAPGLVHAAPDEDLERTLLEALRPVPDLRRQENAGKAIRLYKAAGIIPMRPAARIDYTDYYQVRKPMTFLGNELVMIEEEYMAKFVGCCVDNGAGVFVRVTSDLARMRAFADANKCRVEEFSDERELAKGLNLPAPLRPGRYASLRCHDRDELRQ